MTAFVAFLGAIGGALGGIVIAAALIASNLINGDVTLSFLLQEPKMSLGVAIIAAAVGAVCGAVLGPLYVWTVLRAVPLWRAIGETAFAAAVCVGIALMTLPTGITIWGGALLGSFAAAARLNIAYRRREALIDGRPAS